MKKKILSLFLALTLCLSLLPTAAFAEGDAQDLPEQGEEILVPEQPGEPEEEPVLEDEQEGLAGVSAPQTGAANSEIAVRATGGHSQNHTTICNTYGCTKHNALSWSAISSVDELTSATGEDKGYYLTTELELTEPWVPTGTVNLCLSGHSITLRAGTEDAPQSVITVNSNVQLNISNCIAIKPDSTSEGIYYGGSYVRHAEHAVGPGITVSNGGTVELFGGNITQNSDGVVVENGGTLNMPSNSEVSGNTGAGVRVENGGTLNISGGKIGSNEGCGVDVAQGSTFNVSGGTEILRNTKNGETCNVYLHDSATVKVSKLSQAKIGVTVETPPTDGNFVPVTSDNQASRSDQNCITSDNAAYRVFYSTSKSANNLVLDARPTPLHSDHDKSFVNSLSSSEEGKLLINGEEAGKDSDTGSIYYVLPDGNYYLEDDLTLSNGLLAYGTKVVLCLNGHNITVTGYSNVVYVGKRSSSASSAGNGEVTLTDCASTPGMLTHSNGQGGGVCVNGGTFIMRGGKISGNNSGVYVYQGNEFKIYGGEISGNKSYGVSLTPVSGAYSSSNGEIYMTVGGTAKITGNWADGTYNAETHLYEQGATGTARNVYYYFTKEQQDQGQKLFKYITVDSSLTTGAEIGVTIWKEITAERGYVAVATYGTANTADATPYVQYFKSDSDAYKVWSVENKVVIGVRNSEDQTHPVCGAVCSHKDTDGKPLHKDIVWTPVSDELGLNNNGDNLYLTQDIELSRTWEISNGSTVNLCLNGHTIKANGDFDAITLKGNTNTLNICDCSKSCSGKITHGTKEDHTTYSGAGVYMTAAGGRKATVNMYGGTITGNTGHKVEIKGTTSTCGGGVYVDENAQFFMRGGSITGNTADVGGGVYYTVSTSLFVSGNVNITNNKNTGNAVSNVYVLPCSGVPKTIPFCIDEEGLGEEARIGVWAVIDKGTYSPVARLAPYADKANAYHKGNFILDNAGDYSLKVERGDDSTVVNLYNGVHKHPICGETCTDSSKHDDVVWLPLTSENGEPYAGSTKLGTGNFSTTVGYVLPAGHYYLSDALNLDKPLLIKNGVYLCLNGQTLTVQSSNRAVIIDTGCDLTLCDCSEKQTGKITHATGATGGGVYMGTSTGTANSYNGSFTMYGGSITGNHIAANSGAGVYMCYGTFNMHGGSITGNTTAENHGTGGVYVSGGEFNMTGGRITDTGGGVRVDSKGTFNMSGDAVISNNDAYSGGGVYVYAATFNMSGNASVSGNTASYGGGVYVGAGTASAAAKFNMSGNASISGNSANYGGGVYVYGSSSFTMSEKAAITGNNVNNDGGVYVNGYTATTTVSGDVQITGNWKNGTKNAGGVYEQGENGSANNFYLFGEAGKNQQTITIGGVLETTARIGVTTCLTPTASNPIKIATGATGAQIHYARVFTPDVQGQGYTIILPDNSNLYLSAHQHSWKYELNEDGKTITATCTDTTCTSPNGGNVTISKPKHEVYRDGKDATAKVTQNSWAADTVSDVTYKNYTGDETPLSPAPTDAGHYIASITVGGKTAWVDYEIGKATPTADDFNFTAPTDPTYNGEVKSADFMWVDGVSGMGKIGIRHYNESGEMVIPKDAGTYTVKITVAEGTNYKAAEAELTKDSWTFTILQADYTGQKSDKTIDIVKGRSTAQSGTLTAADFFPEGTELPAGAKIASVTPASGTMMASVTVNDGTLTYTSNTNITATENESYTVTISTTNYNNFTVTLTFRPADKQPQTGFGFKDVVDSKVTKTYGDPDFKFEATGQVSDSKEVLYFSSDPTIATVGSDGTVHILKVSTKPITITATASATDDYAQGVATYELTVNKKTLTKDDLEFTPNSTFTKEYDGNTTCTTATVQIKADAKVNQNDDLPTVTGTYAYNSKDVKDANKVTFTSAASDNTNYILPANLTVEHAASITKCVLTVGEVDTISKTYNTYKNALDCVTGIELIGTVSGETLRFYTSAETGGDYGITGTNFDSADAGQNKTITGTVVLLSKSALASNYTFKVDGKESSTAPFTATGEITPADGGSKGGVERTQKFTDGDPKTETIAWKQLLPAGQTWNYVSEYYSASSVTVDHRTDDNGALTYTITGGKENDVVVFTVSAKCNNYNDFTYTVRVTLTARDSQALEFKGVENGKVTKTYGNQPFTQTVTGEKTDVTYTSSNERVATVDNDGKVTIVGAGDTTITATAAQTNDYASASASYTLTVNKLRIAVPAPGKNKLEYDGTTQTYMPDRLDTAYCTITDNTAKDVRANNAHYTATVSLNDKANTEWDIATENDTSNQTYDFWITPATAIVTALDKKITTGQSAPALANAKLGEDYTITGLYGSDSLGSIVLYYADPSNTATEVNPDTSKAGTYAIVAVGGTGNPNYAPTFHTGTLTIANRPSAGGGAVTYPVSIPDKVENGSVSSDVKNASKGSTVTITIKPEDGFKLANLTVIDKDGNKLEIADKGDGKYTFIMPAGKVEVKASFTKEVETSPFADVATDAYYYEAVKWAAEQGITGGTGSGLFSPDYTCTRAQIVTFLWRAAGSPEPKAMSGFSDVPENSYYAKAVAWAVENGITVGTSSTTFSPEATCTRAQSVTFLFRAAKASADGTPAFSDVTANAYYAEAVKWATDNGITNGIGGGLFGSNNDCTRAQIVTFLWRLYAGK